MNASGAQAGSDETAGTISVETVVIVLIPEYRQVWVRDADSRQFALTRMTQGIDLASLHEGQRVVCAVTKTLARVVAATALDR